MLCDVPVNRRQAKTSPNPHQELELETRLELATYGLQDRCATDCATPAMPKNPTQARQLRETRPIVRVCGVESSNVEDTQRVEQADSRSWGRKVRDAIRNSSRQNVATIDEARTSPPPSVLAPVDLTDPAQVAAVMQIGARIGEILIANGTTSSDAIAQIRTVTSSYGLHYCHVDITVNTITMNAVIGGCILYTSDAADE